MLSKKTKMLRLSALSLAVAGAMSFSHTATAEVSASVAVSNMYLWRGQDLGQGNAQVSGDLSYSVAGFHTSLWTGSGDFKNGTETDVYAGYGIESGDFSADLTIGAYEYPQNDALDDFNDVVEAILSLGFGPVSFGWTKDIANGGDYNYFTLGVAVDKFSATLGYASHDWDEKAADFDPTSENDYVHLDLSYAYNDNLTFTISQVVDQDEFAGDVKNVSDDPLYVVSYSLPLGD